MMSTQYKTKRDKQSAKVNKTILTNINDLRQEATYFISDSLWSIVLGQ